MSRFLNIVFLLLPIVACADDELLEYSSNADSNYVDYILTRDNCSSTATLQRSSKEAEWNFLMLSMGCGSSFDIVLKDFNNLLDNFHLRPVLRKIKTVRVSIDSSDLSSKSPWVKLIRYANNLDEWPNGIESKGDAAKIYINDAVYALLKKSDWLNPISDIFSVSGCKLDIKGKRSYTEDILLITKKQIVNQSLLGSEKVMKSSYPYGFFVDFSVSCGVSP